MVTSKETTIELELAHTPEIGTLIILEISKETTIELELAHTPEIEILTFHEITLVTLLVIIQDGV